MTENLTLETFKEKIHDFEKNEEWVFNGDKPCVIDFYADWCGPCKMLSPILEELSNEYDNINIYKIDTEKEAELSAIFGIMSIPTMLFIPMDQKPMMLKGALPKSELIKIFDKILLKKNEDNNL